MELFGFVGGCKGDIIEISSFILGGHRLESVRVAVPYVNAKMNIVGHNVLELFKYLVEIENSLIYFAENPRPNISERMHCRKIYIVSDAEKGVENKNNSKIDAYILRKYHKILDNHPTFN